MKNKKIIKLLIVFAMFCLILSLVLQNESDIPIKPDYIEPKPIEWYTLDNIPEYSETMGKAYVIIDNNEPNFIDVISSMDVSKPFQIYSDLISGDRCGPALANVCKATLTDEDRESITINPSGWQSISGDFNYNGTTDWLYDRSHLIAYKLTGDNNNKKNLITATAYTNRSVMKIFENRIVEYVTMKPNEFVLYRVTPIFEGENLVASGIHLEAMSIDANGDATNLKFNVYVYNVQKGVIIDYKTGKAVW